VDAYRETQRYDTTFWYRTIGATDSETYCQTRVIIDDLGKEPTCVLYGQTEEVLDRVMCQRYDDWCRTGAKTHATSNLSPLELDRRYGRRITDRLRDLCVWVELKIPSQRGGG
jgi:DNA replication protein DnaC